MSFRPQTEQEKAQWKEVFQMRLLVLLFFVIVFSLLSWLCLRAMLRSGVEDSPVEWSLQIGEDTASLIALPTEESGMGQTPRIDLNRLVEYLSLSVLGEESKPEVQLRQSQNHDHLQFSDGSHIVMMNGVPIFLSETVEVKEGKLLVSVSFLQEYFDGLAVEVHSQTGIIRITKTQVPFGVKAGIGNGNAA